MFGERVAIVAQLAGRLHYHRVARLYLDDGLDALSLQRFCELLASDGLALEQQGDFDWLIDREQLTGIGVELLQLERLFAEEDTGAERDSIWETLTHQYREENEETAPLDWSTMTSDPEQIEHFVAYVLGNTAKLAALTPERSQGDILHWMCERKADRLTICDIMSPSCATR